jgi:hypothetical protein
VRRGCLAVVFLASLFQLYLVVHVGRQPAKRFVVF